MPMPGRQRGLPAPAPSSLRGPHQPHPGQQLHLGTGLMFHGELVVDLRQLQIAQAQAHLAAGRVGVARAGSGALEPPSQQPPALLRALRATACSSLDLPLPMFACPLQVLTVIPNSLTALFFNCPPLGASRHLQN